MEAVDDDDDNLSSRSVIMARTCHGRVYLPTRDSLRVEREPEDEEEDDDEVEVIEEVDVTEVVRVRDEAEGSWRDDGDEGIAGRLIWKKSLEV